MPTVHPFLWFEDKAETAANYYVSVFKNSRIKQVVKYPQSAEAIAGQPAGSVMTVDLELAGQHFTFLNGGKVPGFEFSSATSFVISCDDQAEIDHYWEKLSAVPEAEQCGWCKDKFGVTWQVVPAVLDKMLIDPDQAKVERVTACFMPMKKLDIAALDKAYAGK